MGLSSRALRAAVASCTTLALWATLSLAPPPGPASLVSAQEGPSAAPAALPETVTPRAAMEAAPRDATVEPREKFTIILPIFTNTPTSTRTPTPVNIGNFVWDDLDGDGRQDAGEPGLSGITVQLWNAAKNQMLDQDVTNASGNYTVTAPQPMQVRVRVVLPGGGDQFSPKDQAGGDDTDDSDINPTGTDAGFTDIIDIASNVISMTSVDAGIRPFKTPTPTRTPTPVNIGNFVWHDLDGDGRQDDGEPGIAGVVVQLWNAAKTEMLDQDVTNASGNYTLTAPQPMQVRVRVLIPPGSGASFSPKNQAGGDDGKDSDINTSVLSLNRGFTDIIDIASNVISMTNVDAGLVNVGPFPTPTSTPMGGPTATPTSTNTATPEGFVNDEPLVYVPWAGR